MVEVTALHSLVAAEVRIKEQAPEAGQAHVTEETKRINFFQTWKIILSSLSAFPHLQDTQLSEFSPKLFYSIPRFPDCSAESS